MCGICGIVASEGASPPDPMVVARMSRAMTHRGPDEDGSYCDERAVLGVRRLSIIDVAGGHQPMTNEDGSLRIVYNGEIYNYRELQRFLINKGHTFRTQSDTEVILHLFEECGTDALDHLSGIFAFAIWNARRRTLFAARDRLGVKPLYYSVTARGLTFGSEMKVVLEDPDVPRRLDLTGLNEYLSYEYVPTPRTILQDVRRVPAGHYLTWDGRDVRLTEYYRPSLARSESQPPVKWREFASRMRDTLDEAVREELVSDVPVGVLLSGGLDSSSVAASMVRAYDGRVQSFSVAYEERSFDESRFARTVAAHLGTEHHELQMTRGMAAAVVPRIADVLDEPLGDASFIPTYLLSQFARRHVKVVLGGDGSDELFGGYPTLVAHRSIEYYERVIPWAIRTYGMQALIKRLPVSFDYFSRDFKIRRFLAGRGVPLEVRHHRWMGSFFDEEKAQLFQDWVKPVLGDTYAAAFKYAAECDARQPLNRVLYDDLRMYLESDILLKVDRASMGTSLEVRVPFLNRRVVEFATALPLELKLKRFTGKYLLKRAMADRLPPEILKRPKQGFAMPVAHWIASELKTLVADMLSADRLQRQGLFNPDYVTGLLRDHLARTRDNRKVLWTLLVFQLWHERYLERR
jgi:asparagine synthase (glutamine-hydrolysing)